jgi:hypothetical protein
MIRVAESERRSRGHMLRFGAMGALFGTLLSVAAGIGFGNLTNEVGTEHVLREIAARPAWYWPAVHLSFILGAILWVTGFIGIASSLKYGASWVLGWLGVVALIIGTSIHIVDSSISGFGLTALADAWASAPATDQPGLLRTGDTLLYVLNGTWRSVHSYFHGLPFILSGLAVAFSHRYPAWIGWLGVAGGTGSLLGGMLQFLDVIPGSEQLVVVPAQVVSLWMLTMAVLVWRRAGQREPVDEHRPALPTPPERSRD